jgi:hypothetical protein
VKNNVTRNTNSKYRTAATLYIQEIWFVSGVYIIINTLHKDDKYNNNSNNNNNNTKFRKMRTE